MSALTQGPLQDFSARLALFWFRITSGLLLHYMNHFRIYLRILQDYLRITSGYFRITSGFIIILTVRSQKRSSGLDAIDVFQRPVSSSAKRMLLLCMRDDSGQHIGEVVDMHLAEEHT
jgi:hypothetical protein